MTFNNLNYEVTLPISKEKLKEGGPKTYVHKIIKDVSGYAMPGQTMYIMGASGAGKTSLLNILSDRISLQSGAKLSGERVMNDTMKINDSNFGLLSGYVMQDDVLFAYFTPREALTFAANLKLASLSQEDREKRVDELVDQLGLKNCQNTIIGSIF